MAVGRKTGGRRKGSLNKTTQALKDAILLAAADVGEDQKGKGGLKGYLTFLAKEEPKAFSSLLGRVLPMQVTGDDDGPVKAHVTVEFVSPDGKVSPSV